MYRCLLFILILSTTACWKPKLSPAAVKLEAKKLFFKHLKDTSQIGILEFSSEIGKDWYVAYNIAADTANLVFYLNDDYIASHNLKFRTRPACVVDRVNFQDLTGDGLFDLIVGLNFDYGLTYHRHEVLVYEFPFQPERMRRIFECVTYQDWAKIPDFDADSGNPNYNRVVENDAKLILRTGSIELSGTINYEPNFVLDWIWNDSVRTFVPTSARTMLKMRERAEANGSTRGMKLLVPVRPDMMGCKSFQLLGRDNKIAPVPPEVDAALRCVGVVNISKSGRYLIFEDSIRAGLWCWDFEKQRLDNLYRYTDAVEGASNILWSPTSKSFVTVIVNQEEFIDNTRVLCFTFDKDGTIRHKSYDAKVRYDCQDGICQSQAGIDFYYKSDRELVYGTYKDETDERDGDRLLNL